MREKLNILLFCDYLEGTANTIIDHISAFKEHSKHNILTLNVRPDFPDEIILDHYDVLVLHYSIVISKNNYLSPKARETIRNFKGLKIVFIQDDYRWVNRTSMTLDYLGIDVLFGLAAPHYANQMYLPHFFEKKLRYEMLYAGYSPQHLLNLKVPSYEERQMDVCYRARKLPAWLGIHGQQKWLIGDRFLKDAPKYGLKCDISWLESDRIYGDAWVKFLMNSKAALGTECGASLCDFDATLQKRVETYERKHPNASFDQIRNLFFKDLDEKIYVSGISPRVFEQAALRTLMILYEGEYSGVLVPGRHYLKLEKDHSNMDEIVSFLRDPKKVKEMTECAYHEIAANPKFTYEEMIQRFDQVVSEMISDAHLSSEPKLQLELDYFLRVSNNQVILTKEQKKTKRMLKIYYTYCKPVTNLIPLPFKQALIPIIKLFLSKPAKQAEWFEETKEYKEYIKKKKSNALNHFSKAS